MKTADFFRAVVDAIRQDWRRNKQLRLPKQRALALFNASYPAKRRFTSSISNFVLKEERDRYVIMIIHHGTPDIIAFYAVNKSDMTATMLHDFEPYMEELEKGDDKYPTHRCGTRYHHQPDPLINPPPQV